MIKSTNKFRAIFFALSVFVILGASPITLQAGWVYNLNKSEPDKGDAKEEIQMFLEGNMFSITQPGGYSMIFDRSSNTMNVVDHGNKSYTELDDQTIEKMSAKMDQAMKQYEQAMEQVPEAQRGMVERMMKQKMPGIAEAKEQENVDTKLQTTGESKTINGYSAKLTEYFVDGQKKREFWVAPWSELKGDGGIAEAFQDFSGFMDSMMNTLSSGPMGNFMNSSDTSQDMLRKFKDLGGFPVLTRELNAQGKVVSETVLKNIESRELGDEVFRVPEGYKQNTLDFGG